MVLGVSFFFKHDRRTERETVDQSGEVSSLKEHQAVPVSGWSSSSSPDRTGRIFKHQSAAPVTRPHPDRD